MHTFSGAGRPYRGPESRSQPQLAPLLYTVRFSFVHNRCADITEAMADTLTDAMADTLTDAMADTLANPPDQPWATSLISCPVSQPPYVPSV
jgi:hypothetical protein